MQAGFYEFALRNPNNNFAILNSRRKIYKFKKLNILSLFEIINKRVCNICKRVVQLGY